MNDDARAIHTVYRLKLCDQLKTGLTPFLKDPADTITEETFNVCSMWKYTLLKQRTEGSEELLLKEKFELFQQINELETTMSKRAQG